MKKNDLFNLSHDEYSNYEISNTMRALKDFTMAHLKAHIEDTGECMSDGDKEWSDLYDVPEFMIKHGYCEKIPCGEINVGGYGMLDPKETES